MTTSSTYSAFYKMLRWLSFSFKNKEVQLIP